MPRIRSVHPGLFTDEAFMAASPHARLLMIGLWTECDDQGIFEWKPLTLKARLMPADNVDMPALLGELETLNAIKRFEVAGKAYGAARNFLKYQRPKYPSKVHPLTEDVALYVCFSDPPPPVLPQSSPSPPGKPLQMEDGEEEIIGKKEVLCPKPPPKRRRISYPARFEGIWAAYPTDANMSKSEALPAWERLDDSDQALVEKSIPAFVAYCKANPDYRPVHLCRYLSKRRFEGFAAEGAAGRFRLRAVEDDCLRGVDWQ